MDDGRSCALAAEAVVDLADRTRVVEVVGGCCYYHRKMRDRLLGPAPKTVDVRRRGGWT